MGSGSSSKKAEIKSNQMLKKQENELKRIFNSSYFNSKSLFWTKTCSTLFNGGYSSDTFLVTLFKAFRKFMIEAAIYMKTSNSASMDTFVLDLTPPPLVDEVWCKAIEFPEQYSDLCNHLVGQKIYRVKTAKLTGFEKVFKKFWTDYDPEFWPHDKKYTIWVLNCELDSFIQEIYEYYFLRNLKKPQEVFKVYFHLNMIRNLKSQKRPKEASKRFYSEPNETNYFYGLDLSANAEKIYESVLENLTKEIKEFVEVKFCFGELANVYFEEYSRFLTMAYFQPSLVTASYEVEMIWNVHRSFNLDYYRFCQTVFGKEIPYESIERKIELKVNLVKGYQKTLDLYVALFKQTPVSLVWPTVDDFVGFGNFQGSWFSVVRIIESVQKVMEIYDSKECRPADVIAAYYCWGKGLSTQKIKDYIESRKVFKESEAKKPDKSSKSEKENKHNDGGKENKSIKEPTGIILLDEGSEPIEIKWQNAFQETPRKSETIKTKKTLKDEEGNEIDLEHRIDEKEKTHKERKESKKNTKKNLDEGVEEEKKGSPKRVQKNKSPLKGGEENNKIKDKSPKKEKNLVDENEEVKDKAKKTIKNKDRKESPLKQSANLLDDSSLIESKPKNKKDLKSPSKDKNQPEPIIKEPKNKKQSPVKDQANLLDDSDIVQEKEKHKKKSIKQTESPIREKKENKKPEILKYNEDLDKRDLEKKVDDDEMLERKVKTMKNKEGKVDKKDKAGSKSKDNSFVHDKKVKNEDLLGLNEE